MGLTSHAGLDPGGHVLLSRSDWFIYCLELRMTVLEKLFLFWNDTFLLLFPLTYFSVRVFEFSPRNLLEAFYLKKKSKTKQASWELNSTFWEFVLI